MPIEIRCSRRGGALKRRKLVEDDKLWRLTDYLRPLLVSTDPQRLDSSMLVSHLRPEYPDLEMQEDGVVYEKIWDPAQQMWRVVCHELATITIPRDDPPLEIRVDASASYG